jgi:hypothetical protein
MNEATLPEAFRDLEPWLDWALPTEAERMRKRVASSMAEITAFYTAISARIEAAITYLNQYHYAELPPPARRLCDMALSLVEVSSLVEMYKDPARLYMPSADRFVPIE